MVKMLTLFGVEDLRELKYNDLKRELAVQKFILLAIRYLFNLQSKTWKGSSTQLQEDKKAIVDTYTKHLEAFIAEIEFVIAHRSEPLTNRTSHRSKKQIRQENKEKRKDVKTESAKLNQFGKSMERDGLYVSWDRDRFMLIAQDRGYQTEEAIVQDVGKELNLDMAKARMLINRGRFTWGQVLCVGAMLEMTPKEFCDTFLAGYFTEQHGEYRADYENLCKEELLKAAYKPIKLVEEVIEEVVEPEEPEEIEQPEEADAIEIEEVIVGADGKPLDEEEWF